MGDATVTGTFVDMDDDGSYILERASNSQADTTQTTDSVEEFLIDHFKEDVFEITEQGGSTTPLRSVLKSLFNPKSIGKSDDAEKGTEERRQVTMKLSLAALSRMRMRKLQIQLTDVIMDIHYSKTLPDDWEALLEKYINATRDNDYIRTCVDRGLHDPFLIRSQKKVDAAVLERALLGIPVEKLEKELFTPNLDGIPKVNFVPPLEQEPTAIGGTRTEMTRKQWMEAFIKRALVSIIGGAFLTGPMWIMILVTTTYASPIITTVFVFIAGIAAARVLDNTLSVVSVTAAYAAVLVVFVGVNGSSA
ncbi:hypothetical protein F4814DRAFT_408714 [Daldinia grandis]|nr:hypothetical protein F4814DRAFT_408714 [Daldinia grandis]